MTYYEIIKHLEKEAKKYNEKEYNLFVAEIGWEDWMEYYVEEEDYITEAEYEQIDKILLEAWNNIHKI